MNFTTSWDDGTTTDLRLAELLERYNCTGTFYVCPAERGRHLLTPDDIRTLAQSYEIGAHTLTHPHLPALPVDHARNEIAGSKRWVEEITNVPCTMFCYPYGAYDRTTEELVHHAGFRGARTTRDLQFQSDDAFAFPVSLQVRPFPRRIGTAQWWHRLDPYGPLRVKLPGLLKLGIGSHAWKSWRDLACALFDHAIAQDKPWFHVWGHSSELEKFGLWDELETFLKHVQAASGVEHVVNSVLLPTAQSDA